MANLSQQKRQRMLEFLNKIREEHKDDDETLIALDEIENELNSKKYGLVWEKHEEKVDRMMQDNIPVFTEVKEREIKATDENSYNFLLEGDNLHSLKLLEKTHAGKIDVIYIDPPYNTKKDGFTYSDTLVDGNDGFRHSKWISFMNERLKIAQHLLSEQGMIFISIDENEYAQLRLLSDEVFGELNFVENIVWNKRVPKNDKGIGNIHEYILTYANNSNYKYKLMSSKEGINDIRALINISKQEQWSPEELEKELNKLYKAKKYPRAITLYNCVDNNNRIFGKINMSWPNGNTFGPRYDVIHPITKYPVKVPDRGWRWSEETFNKLVDYDNPQVLSDGSVICGRIWFSKKDSIQPSSIKYLEEVDRMLLRSIISLKSDGGMILESVLGSKSIFAYPKPVTLIKELIDASTYNNKSATILDFFAGSGTTAQAVLELNKEDGGNRKFILCTNNENNICEEVTYERIKRVIHGYADVEGIPANLKYFKTDFIAKDADDVSEELLSHIKEMVELENGITLDNKHYLIVLSDEQADELAKNWSNYEDVKAIYVSRNVLFTSEQDALFSNTEIHIIPDYYFEYELKEVGETW